ncbi:MAG: c-type cytochrome [Hyphomicrobium sp.]
MKKWVLAAAIALAAPAVASAEDVEAGKAQFNKCKACHQIGEGAKNALGPQLNGIVGRKAGTAEGFAGYSEGVKKKGEEGFVWDDANLIAWIQGDDKVIPGNKMIFAGIKDPAEAANVVAYIKSAGGAGAAAPAPAPAP